jgi:hypothetical protein
LGWIGCDYTDKEEPFTPTSSIDIWGDNSCYLRHQLSIQ